MFRSRILEKLERVLISDPEERHATRVSAPTSTIGDRGREVVWMLDDARHGDAHELPGERRPARNGSVIRAKRIATQAPSVLSYPLQDVDRLLPRPQAGNDGDKIVRMDVDVPDLAAGEPSLGGGAPGQGGHEEADDAVGVGRSDSLERRDEVAAHDRVVLEDCQVRVGLGHCSQAALESSPWTRSSVNGISDDLYRRRETVE